MSSEEESNRSKVQKEKTIASNILNGSLEHLKSDNKRLISSKIDEYIQTLAELDRSNENLKFRNIQKHYLKMLKTKKDETEAVDALVSLTNPSTTSPSNDSTEATVTEKETPKKRGRKRKKTAQEIEEEQRKKMWFDHTMEMITHRWFALREKTKEKNPNGRVSSKMINDIICNECHKNGVDVEEMQLKKDTINTRVTRGNLNSGHKLTTIIAPVEPLLVEMAIKCNSMGNGLGRMQMVRLANSLIEGSSYSAELRRHHTSLKMKGADSGTLGLGWYYGFLNRYGDILRSKSPTLFPNNRSKWTTYDNFKIMYNNIYDILVESNVAKEVEPYFINDANEKVDSDYNSKKYEIKHELTMPGWVLHSDEVGDNTNMKDGATRRKIVCVTSDNPVLAASTSDNRFTTIPIISSSGNPVAANVIFDGCQQADTTLTGDDIFAEYADNPHTNNPTLDYRNHGPGRRNPGLPTCFHNGRQIPGLQFTAPGASISGEKLLKILEHFDKLSVFDRKLHNATPVFIVDSHISRLDIKFLRYICNPETKWNVCIGCPEGTHKWQVGDAETCNGEFKVGCASHKKKILDKRMETEGTQAKLLPSDIIPIINAGFEKSFAVVSSNQRELFKRGWGPLNRALLQDPDILATKRIDLCNDASATSTSLSNSLPKSSSDRLKYLNLYGLNFSRAYCGRVFTDIFHHEEQSAQIKENLKKKREDKRTLKEKALATSRVTGGFFFGQEELNLGSINVLECMEARHKAREAKVESKLNNAIARYKLVKGNALAALLDICAKLKQPSLKFEEIPFQQLSNKTQKYNVVRWKHRKALYDNKKAFSNLDATELSVHWEQYKHRPDMTLKEWLRSERGFEEHEVEDVTNIPAAFDIQAPNFPTSYNDVVQGDNVTQDATAVPPVDQVIPQSMPFATDPIFPQTQQIQHEDTKPEVGTPLQYSQHATYSTNQMQPLRPSEISEGFDPSFPLVRTNAHISDSRPSEQFHFLSPNAHHFTPSASQAQQPQHRDVPQTFNPTFPFSNRTNGLFPSMDTNRYTSLMPPQLTHAIPFPLVCTGPPLANIGTPYADSRSPPFANTGTDRPSTTHPQHAFAVDCEEALQSKREVVSVEEEVKMKQELIARCIKEK